MDEQKAVQRIREGDLDFVIRPRTARFLDDMDQGCAESTIGKNTVL